MNCEICGTQLKDLFTSNYCPNDCDKKPAKISAMAHPDMCVAKQPTDYKAFTRPTTGLVTNYQQQSLAAENKIVCDYFKAIFDNCKLRGYTVKTSYQVHDEVCFEFSKPRIDFDSLEKKLVKYGHGKYPDCGLKEMTYKRLGQPNKETKFVYGDSPILKIIKDILYYDTLKQVSSKMYQDFYTPYDSDLFTNKQVAPAGCERPYVEQQTKEENL